MKKKIKKIEIRSKKQLLLVIQQFLDSLDNEIPDEWYVTDRGLAEESMTLFKKFLGIDE